MKTEYKVIALSILFGSFTWVTYSILDCFVFHEGTLCDLLFRNVLTHKILVMVVSIVSSFCFGLFITDVVAKRRRAEEARRESERHYQALENASPVGILHTDAEGNYRYVNKRWCEITGLSLEDVVEQGWTRTLHPEDRQRVLRQWRQATRKDRPFRSEYRFSRPDGVTVWVFGQAVSEKTSGGEVVGYIGTIADITQRKYLENELQNISERERERIGQDLHDVLSQYLVGITCMANVLRTRLSGKSLPEAADAAKIETVTKEALTLTRSLAKGLLPIPAEPEGLWKALEELASNTEQWFGISCIFHPQEKLLVEDYHLATQLFRIAQEALNNAIRHGKAKCVTIELRARDNQMILRVKDNGVGISELDGKHQGMGLSIMKHRAKMIGGTLEISRQVDGGTLVTCLVPL